MSTSKIAYQMHKASMNFNLGRPSLSKRLVQLLPNKKTTDLYSLIYTR